MAPDQSVVVFANKGTGSNEEDRIRELLAPLAPTRWEFDRGSKVRMLVRLVRRIGRERPDVVVMEGTGLAGGIAILLGRAFYGVPYIVSSGDAVAPFFRLHRPALWPVGLAYEKLLYRISAGFIGWTPYLVGRALTFGAPRAMTAAGWAPFGEAPGEGASIRQRLGISPSTLVIGLVGALNWSRHEYCYGLELVRAVRRVDRPDIAVIVVGDGDGRERLLEEAGADLDQRVFLPGAVSQEDVPAYLDAFDVGSLPQSLDGVGSYRYTTKISEYLAAGLPVVSGQLPFAYDLDDGWVWRLSGREPWSGAYADAMARWMQVLTRSEVAAKRERIPSLPSTFDRELQSAHVSAFVRELLDEQQ